jgi:hypothetical protein
MFCHILLTRFFPKRLAGTHFVDPGSTHVYLSLFQFRQLLQNFVNKELSFAIDTIRAFDGILNVPSTGNHFHGIPSSWFHEMMLWNCDIQVKSTLLIRSARLVDLAHYIGQISRGSASVQYRSRLHRRCSRSARGQLISLDQL